MYAGLPNLGLHPNAGGPALNLDFISSETLDSRITASGGANGTRTNSSGVIVAASAPRFDYGDVRTNYLRNTTMAGGSAPSTMPTWWTGGAGNWTYGGIVPTVAYGTEDNISYIEFTWVGTTSAQTALASFFDYGWSPAAQGQTWTLSAYARLTNGALPAVGAVTLAVREYDSGSVFQSQGLTTLSATNASLVSQRFSHTRTLASAATTQVAPSLRLDSTLVAIGTSVNMTLRIAAPQLEMAGSATAFIPTSGSIASAATAKGVLIEESRTNSIRNNTMVGGTAPSTMPTNWGNALNFAMGGVTPTVAYGSENGISYIDLTYAGNTTAASGTAAFFDTANIAAVVGQTWTLSAYVKLISGSLPAGAITQLSIREYDSGAVFLTQGVLAFVPTGASLISQRPINTYTLANASTASIQPALRSDFTSVTIGTSLNVTIRIGMPQLELGAFATSVIPTTSAAVTRTADSLSMTGTNFSSWYSGTGGTLFSEASIPYTVPASSLAAVAEIGDGTYSNRELLYFDSTNILKSSLTLSGAGVILNSTIVASANSTAKFAHAFASGDQALSANSSTVVTNTSPATLPAVNALRLGVQGGGGGYLNGTIRRLRYWSSRLPNNELQQITA